MLRLPVLHPGLSLRCAALYNPRIGIVRKCDMCSQRLAVRGSRQHACRLYPHEAIRIQVVNVEQVKADTETSQFLPERPTRNTRCRRPITRPNSRCRAICTGRSLSRVQTEHAHGPLITMLVLTATVGRRILDAVNFRADERRPRSRFAAVDSMLNQPGGMLPLALLTASLLHISDVRGWRIALRPRSKDELYGRGREIFAFGLFAATATWLTLPNDMADLDAWHRDLIVDIGKCRRRHRPDRSLLLRHDLPPHQAAVLGICISPARGSLLRRFCSDSRSTWVSFATVCRMPRDSCPFIIGHPDGGPFERSLGTGSLGSTLGSPSDSSETVRVAVDWTAAPGVPVAVRPADCGRNDDHRFHVCRTFAAIPAVRRSSSQQCVAWRDWPGAN